jgi:uncharacterized membrane protein (DUF2068 family)
MSEHEKMHKAADELHKIGEVVSHTLTNRRKLRIVAILEIAKGTATLLLATGLLSMAPGALQALLLGVIARLRWLPDMGLPEKIEKLTNGFDEHRLAFAIGVTLYILIRYAEAYGLWKGLNWARWLGLVGVTLYIPFEIREIVKHPGWGTIAVFAFNLLIIWLLWPPKHGPHSAVTVPTNEKQE